MEPLEARHLMDAAGLAVEVSPVWFQSVTTQSALEHAGSATWTEEDTIVANTTGVDSALAGSNLLDWIVQFDTTAVANMSSVAETASLLAGGGIQFEVICGLGLVGQVLVRSADASFESVETWLSNNVSVAGFEQDAFHQTDIASEVETDVVSNDPDAASQWDMSIIDAQDAWNYSTGSSSVVVGVIDTGVDYTHPDLAANIWTNPGEVAGNGLDDDGNGFVDDIHGYDFVNNDGNPMDDNGHGTHVSGTIAAVGNNALGISGVNWSSSIMALKFLDASGAGYLSDAVRAVNYATMMRSRYGVNIRVTNNSWGGGPFSASLQNAIAANSSAGILFVAAAGNKSTNNDTSPQYPANYTSPNVISVAATDSNDRLAAFSCYGATTVDLAAPGVSIYSTMPNNSYGTMSGTSMASPHVAGVAALAFAAVPTATMIQVRDAILQGVDSVTALAGATVTGGRLNAYNTLSRLGAQSQGPAIGSLTSSLNPVMAGTNITLTAGGLTDSLGTVTRVSFYADSNGNGQYDSGDAQVGLTASIAGGAAAIVIGTSGLAPGSYVYFARALDTGARWSPAATLALTVVAQDDFGNNAAAAASVAMPSSTFGVLGITTDTDWFKFSAVAGRTYVLSTVLGTLGDSVITLYDRNGTTQLTQNDDGGNGRGSQITWTPATSGVYYVAVTSYNRASVGTYTLNVQRANSVPALADIANQSIPHTQTTLTVYFSATDGDPLTYSTSVMAYDALQQKAYTLDQQLGLQQDHGTYYTNYRGANEKYLIGSDGTWYFLLSSGEFYRWGGSLAASTLVDTFSSDYYANPALLHAAPQPSLSPVAGNEVSVSIVGNAMTITRAADYVNDFYVTLTARDGFASDASTFKVTVTNSAVSLAAIADKSLSHAQTTLSVPLNVTNSDNDTLKYSTTVLAADPIVQAAYDLDRTLGLEQDHGTYYTNYRGANEKYLIGNNNTWYFILPDGSLYRWNGSLGASTLVATLRPSYYANPSLLHAAPSAPLEGVAASDVSATVSGSTLTITRAADYLSDFYVRVMVSDGYSWSEQTFKVAVTNDIPTLAGITDRTIPFTQTTLTFPAPATDSDGDALTYTASVVAIDALAQKAYTLDQQLGLRQDSGTYYTNFRGANEKYLIGNDNKWYFILPSGELYRWGESIAASTLIETLAASYYTNPALLHNATAPVMAAVDSTKVSVVFSGGTMTITRAAWYVNDFYVQLGVTDGVVSTTKTVKIAVTSISPKIVPITDQTISHDQTTLNVSLGVAAAASSPLSYSAEVLATDPTAKKAYDLDQQLGLRQDNGTYYTNYRGVNEKYLIGNDGTWYFLRPNGELYRWGESIAASTLVATLDASYYANPALLHNAQAPLYASVSSDCVNVNITNGLLTVTRAANYVNDFYVRVRATNGASTDVKTFKVAVTNSAPALAAIANQTMTTAASTLSVALRVTNTDGDPLTYVTQVLAIDPTAQRAYKLDQQVGLRQDGGTYYTNYRGANEKYLIDGSNTWYFLLPSGALYRWGGSIATSTLVDTFGAAYYANPSLLHAAQPASMSVVDPSHVTAAVSGATLTVTRTTGYLSEFYVQVRVGDGMAVDTEMFRVTVVANASVRVAGVTSLDTASVGATAAATQSPATAARVALASMTAEAARVSSRGSASVSRASAATSALAAESERHGSLFVPQTSGSAVFGAREGRLDNLLSASSRSRRGAVLDTEALSNRERLDTERKDAAEDLLACDSVEREIVDELFDMLGSL